MNWHSYDRLPFAMLAITLLAASACRVTDMTLWSPPAERKLCDVEIVRGTEYCSDDSAARPFRHQLDLYLPRGVKNYPVVVFVHGGAWLMGDNRCCGLYSSVGKFLAGRGIGAVLPNYRLSPGVKHPEHIKDVARAFAWTRAHIGEYGGRADQLFIAGHSAGGHLAALLATDERYLKAEGLSTADVKGAIGVSGVYRLPSGNMEVQLGGTTSLSFRIDEIAPLRREGATGAPSSAAGAGIPLSVNVFGPAFGDDPQVRADASPINHVRPGLPPFLIVSAARDLPTLGAMADEFHQALRTNGCDAQLLRVDGRNHHSIIFMAVDDRDPVGRAMVDFVRRNAAAEK
jgi:acetyl esterase/lipase